MSKYEPLTRFLQHQPGDEVRLSFAQIEQIVGFKLPVSAQREPDWWSNSPSDDAETHPWLAAGFRSEAVDLHDGELIFRRETSVPASMAERELPRHPIFGCMKGMITVAPGVDLTEPVDPDLADDLDRKYGPAA